MFSLFIYYEIGNLLMRVLMNEISASVEVDSNGVKTKGKESCLLTLLSHNKGVKPLHIEYATFETIEENRDAAVKWADALALCIRRAHSTDGSDHNEKSHR